MPQAMLNIQVDEGLKEQFDLLCLEIGMTPTSVINMFAKAVVKNKKVLMEIISSESEVTSERALQTFYALRKEAKENGLQGMTLDEINQEISSARQDMKV